jgi:hypothetical protein
MSKYEYKIIYVNPNLTNLIKRTRLINPDLLILS